MMLEFSEIGHEVTRVA